MGSGSYSQTALWRMLAISIYLPSILLAIARGILILLIPLYVSKITESYTVIGIATAGISIGMLLFDIPSGYIISRIGVYRSGIILFLMIIGSLLGLYVSRNIVEVIASLIVFGFGFSLWFILRHYILTTEVVFEYRGRASALLGLSMRLGLFIGPIIGGAISTYYGYKEAFLSTLLLAAPSMAIFIMGSRVEDRYRLSSMDRPEHGYRDTGNSSMNEASKGREAFQEIKKYVYVMFILLALIQVIRYGRFFIIPIYGSIVLGLDDLVIGFSMGISGLLDALAAYPSGVIMDRVGRRTSILLSFMVMGAGLVMLSYSYSEALYIASVSVIGLGHGLGSGTMLTMGSDIGSMLDRKSSSRFLGYWHFTSDLGDTLGPISMGVLSTFIALGQSSLALGSLSILVALASYVISFRIENTVRSLSRI